MIKLYQDHVTKDSICLIMEYCNGGNLLEEQVNQENQVFTL